MINVCKVNFVRQKYLANNNDCMSLHILQREHQIKPKFLELKSMVV